MVRDLSVCFWYRFSPKKSRFPPAHILYFPFPPGINSRSRKIRCDSTRPKCQNCLKRGKDCVFDLVRKRRGPDKRPGMRKRSCKKRQSDGSEPNQPKKQRRAEPYDEGTSARADCKQNAELSLMTIPVFVPAHQKARTLESVPPVSTSSHVEGNPSFHDGYYGKVTFPLFLPRLPASLFFLFFVSPPLTMNTPTKRQPLPSSSKQASTSQQHIMKSEISTELPLSHPFESDLRTPETSPYNDPSPPSADDQGACQAWLDELLETYALTCEQA